MARIHFTDRSGVPQSVVLDKQNPEVAVGRLEHLAIVTADASVSRRHCVIRCIGPDYVIEDLQSTHGTLINGVPIHTQKLNNGDEVRCGHFVMRFVDEPDGFAFAEQPAVPAGPPVATLTWTDDQGQRQTIQLDESTPFVTVGRLSDCEIRTNDGATSRRHARIKWLDGAYDVVDLKSVNGTQVNAEPIQRTILKNGDVVSCGNLRIEFVCAEAAVGPATNPPLRTQPVRGGSLGPAATTMPPPLPPPSGAPPHHGGARHHAGASMPTDPVATMAPMRLAEDKPIEVRRLEAEVEVLRTQLARGGFGPGADPQLQRDLEHAQASLHHAQDELNRTRNELQRERDKAAIMVEEYRTRFDRLQRDFDEQRAQLEAHHPQPAGGAGDAEALRAELAEARAAIARHEETIKSKDGRIARLREQLDGAAEEPVNAGGDLDTAAVKRSATRVMQIFDTLQSEIARISAAAKRVNDNDDPLSPGYRASGPSLEELLPRSIRDIRELLGDGREQAGKLQDIADGKR